MTQQVINRGSAPGDGTGDTLYDAFGAVNANFTELFDALPDTEFRFLLGPETNWALNNANYVNIQSNAVNNPVEGIVAPANGHRLLYLIVEVGSMLLKHDSGITSPGNGFWLPAQRDLTVGPGSAVLLSYENYNQRWRVLSHIGPLYPHPNIPAFTSATELQYTYTVSTSTGIPADSRAVRVFSTVDCWLRFGTSGVTADSSTGMFFAEGEETIELRPGVTHICARGQLTGGKLNIAGLADGHFNRVGDARADIALSDVSARVLLPTNNRFIRFVCDETCFVKFGDASVTVAEADGFRLEPGTRILQRNHTGATYLAAIAYPGRTGKVYINGIE